MFIEKMNFAITCCTGLLRTSNNYTSVSLHSKALLRVYFQHSRKDLPIKAYSQAVLNQFSPSRCKKIVCRFFKFGVTASASITAVGFAQNWSLVELCPDVQCHSVSKKENFDDNIFYGFPWSQFFWEYLLPECTRLGVAVVCALIGAALNMYIPVALGDLINALNDHVGTTDGGSYFSALKMPVLHLLSAYLLQGLTTFAYISLLSNVGENVAYKLRRDLYRNFLHQDVSFYDAHKTGELVERLTSDVQDFKSSFKLCVSQGLKSVTQTVGCVTSLYVTSPTMTLALCGTMPLLIALGSLMGMTLRRVSKTAQQHASDSTAKAIEVLANFRTVRAFANEDIEVARYDDIICRLCHVNQMLGIGIGCFQGLTNIALNGIIVSVIGAGGYLVSTGELNAGQLMSFLVSAQMIQRSLSSLSVLFGTAVRGVAAGSRVFDSLNTQPTVLTTGGRKIPYHSLLGHLRFEDVRFTYPTRPNHEVLCGVNLDIRPCQTVAVCGLSGAGKSTVANLVERFYDVSSGRITLDGADIRSLDASWLRGRAIGYIDQDPVLFSGTIAENIRYGKPTAGDDEVERVSRLANAHNFITSFPFGYLTMVGEHGAALSGGQKQRIAIARALLKDPAILILDEATSALDAESEGLVQAALERVMRDRTVLVIAHRLSTIRNADVIAVMRGGKVVETGTHEQLRRKHHGLYRELIKLQESGPDVMLSDDVLG